MFFSSVLDWHFSCKWSHVHAILEHFWYHCYLHILHSPVKVIPAIGIVLTEAQNRMLLVWEGSHLPTFLKLHFERTILTSNIFR